MKIFNLSDEDSLNGSLILYVLEKLHNKNKFTFIKFSITITSEDSMYVSDKLLWKGDPVKKKLLAKQTPSLKSANLEYNSELQRKKTGTFCKILKTQDSPETSSPQ